MEGCVLRLCVDTLLFELMVADLLTDWIPERFEFMVDALRESVDIVLLIPEFDIVLELAELMTRPPEMVLLLEDNPLPTLDTKSL